METGNQKFYFTKQGLEAIKKEYDILREIKLSKIKDEAPSILESEDVNPEYLSFKEDVELLETKLAELEEVIKNSEIIKKPKGEKAKVIDLGAVVDIEIDGKKNEFILVGTYEADPFFGKISNESPVGKALIGRRAGDEIEVSEPIKKLYKIKKVKYI